MLPAVALPVLTPGPAAGTAHTLFELLLGSPNAAFSGWRLLGILDPTDELVAGQRRDVVPGLERHSVGEQRLTQVDGQFMHNATGNCLAGQSHGASAAIKDVLDARWFTRLNSTLIGELPRAIPEPAGPRRALALTACAGCLG